MFDICVTSIGGAFIAGWSTEDPYIGQLQIILLGDHSSQEYPSPYGPKVGAKSIGIQPFVNII